MTPPYLCFFWKFADDVNKSIYTLKIIWNLILYYLLCNVPSKNIYINCKLKIILRQNSLSYSLKFKKYGLFMFDYENLGKNLSENV